MPLDATLGGYYSRLAAAIADYLNDRNFSPDYVFDAVYRKVPLYDIGELKNLVVTVVPAARETNILSRSQNEHKYTVDVALQKKLSGPNAELFEQEIDLLAQLVDDVEQSLDRVNFDLDPRAVWIGSEVDPLWVPDHIEHYRQFTSVIRCKYRVA